MVTVGHTHWLVISCDKGSADRCWISRKYCRSSQDACLKVAIADGWTSYPEARDASKRNYHICATCKEKEKEES